MRLVPYLRVSTERQAEEGTGLDVQLETVQAWATAHGHELVAPRADEGVSGSHGLDKRRALAEALDVIRDGDAEGLVVYRLDRLARDMDLQEWLLREVKRLGGRLFSTSDAENANLDDDPTDPSRRMIRQMLGAVAEYERSMIALRLRMARERKRRNGGYAGHGSPAYGLRSEHGELVPVEAEQLAIERIRALKAEGLSHVAIVEALNAEGPPPKRGGLWHTTTVSRILSRNAPEMVKRRNRSGASAG